MIIKLYQHILFDKYHHDIKHSNTKKLELHNGNSIYEHCTQYLICENPIFLTRVITHLAVAREFSHIIIVPNKNLLSFITNCDHVLMANINSKLSKLIIYAFDSKPLRLSKNLKKIILTHYCNQHIMLPKHLKYLTLYPSYKGLTILPKYIQRINSNVLGNHLVLDGISNNIVYEHARFSEEIIDDFPNNIYDISFHENFVSPLNNLPNCLKMLVIKNPKYKHKIPNYFRDEWTQPQLWSRIR